MISKKKEYEVREISRERAKPFIEKIHYTHSISKVSVAFGLFNLNKIIKVGLFDECVLEGVITYGQVSARDLAQSIFVGGNQKNTLEFLRMAVLDECECPRSWFIAKTIKQLRQKFPEIKCLVSFADQTEGHFGYVYQASNWIYLGMTGKKYHFIVNGKRINKRVAYDRAKSERISEKEFIKLHGWEKVIELPKFRYIYLLDKKIKLKQEIKKYPKGNQIK